MKALQWLGKKHVGVKEMPRPCITDKVRVGSVAATKAVGLECSTAQAALLALS